MMEMEAPYQEELAGILSFSTFAAAEETLRRIEILRCKYRSASDKKGEEYCRRVVALGRRRAESISRNRRVDPRTRAQKREIADWFRIWLETPELFADWLQMRKKTEAFTRTLEMEVSVRSERRHATGRKKSQPAALS